MLPSNAPDSPTRLVQVPAEGGKKPDVVRRLAEWQYVERSFHRLICAWGRWLPEWEDKVELSRHVWEQAEAVSRIRKRLAEFPGTHHNVDAPVSARLQEWVDTVLQAPTWHDAFDGIYREVLEAIVRAYVRYAEAAHAVHDAPTLALLRDLVRMKDQQRRWYRDLRRRRPHATDSDYADRVGRALARAGGLASPLDVDEPARPVGTATGFQVLARARHPRGTEPPCRWTPFLDGDFAHDLEARRLFWCYGYMLEMNLAEDQLLWLFSASDLPWDFVCDVSRHLWDESRHGDSGRSRLMDFGLDLADVGYPYYDDHLPANFEGPDQHEQTRPPLTETELYEQIFTIGMVAETGHFTVKREAYDDFRAAGDLESAEMMLFDIVDETAHVQYAHRWLPLLAERCGRPADEFRDRGVSERQAHAEAAADRQRRASELVRDPADPALRHYQGLLARMRERVPLKPVELPKRSYLPM